MSILAGVTSAQDFEGSYEMSLTGSCLHSKHGFDEGSPPYIPATGSGVWAATMMAHGTWEFFDDGTGTATGLNYVIDFPPGIPPPGLIKTWKGPMARGNPFTLNFEYEVQDGEIVVTLPDGFELKGVVSYSLETMTLNSAYQEYDLTSVGLGHAVCNASRILIKIDDD